MLQKNNSMQMNRPSINKDRNRKCLNIFKIALNLVYLQYQINFVWRHRPLCSCFTHSTQFRINIWVSLMNELMNESGDPILCYKVCMVTCTNSYQRKRHVHGTLFGEWHLKIEYSLQVNLLSIKLISWMYDETF